MRRRALSPELKAIERNVMKHIIQEVRQTYVGWRPATLNPAWTNALKRLEASGKVTFKPEYGGYVPTTWLGRLEKANQSVLGYVRYRHNHQGVGTDGERWTRTRKAALARLQMAGVLEITPAGEFVPSTQTAE